MTRETRSSITLRALEGTPLDDPSTRGMVIASAHAIAERTGVQLHTIEADDASVTVTLGAGRIAAIGFASELRRTTGAWYSRKHAGASLWGEADWIDQSDPDQSGGPLL